MKAFFKNKRGFAFPTVLGTFVLVTSIAAGLFIMVMNMTMMVSSDSDSSEGRFEARNKLDVFLDIVESKDVFFDITEPHHEVNNPNRNFYDDLLNNEFNMLSVTTTAIENQFLVYHKTHTNISGRIQYSVASDPINDEINNVENSIIHGDTDFKVWDEEDPRWNDESGQIEFDGKVDGGITIEDNTIIYGSLDYEHDGGGPAGSSGATSTIEILDGNTLLVMGDLELDVGGNGAVTIIISGDLYVTGNLILTSRGRGRIEVNGNVWVGGNIVLATEGENARIKFTDDSVISLGGSITPKNLPYIDYNENTIIELTGDSSGGNEGGLDVIR